MVGQVQDGALLSQIAGGFAPVVTGRSAVPMTGLEGIPGMNQPGLLGMMMQMMVGPKLQQMMGRYGYAPMGLGHDMNVYDVMRRQQFTQAQQQAMAIASESDEDNFLRTFRGLAAVTGTPWGTQQRRAARQLAETAGNFSPMLAEMFPEMLDQLGGMRGSATLMANRMMLGGRYRLDPVTGRMGMTAETVGQQARSIYRDLYESGDLSAMRGVTAGQLGTMYDELTRRGMIAAPQSPLRERTMDAVMEYAVQDRAGLERSAIQRGVALPTNLADLSADDLDKLRFDPAVEGKLRAFDSERVKRSLKAYIDAVGAVKDIFGDMGRPNAPMSELISALEALTQGGVGQIDSGKLNMMVRNTQELARQSGMSIDQAMAIQQHAAGRAEQLGISPLHAIQAAQGSMAWGSAFRAQGGAAQPAWGRFNADQMQQLDANLRVQAASSQAANRLAVMMRLRESAGGFEEGSTAEAMAQAVMAGETEFLDPQTGQMRSTRTAPGEFGRIMEQARGRGGTDLGITEGMLHEMMLQTRTNEQYTMEHGIQHQVRRQQAQDVQGWVGARMSEAMANRLRAAGMSREEADTLANKASVRVAQRIASMGQTDFADDRTRTTEMANIMREELSFAGGAQFIRDQGLGDQFFRTGAEFAYGYTNRAIREGRMRGFGNMQNMQATMNPETLSQANRNQMQASFAAETAAALQPLGRGTMLQRAVQFLHDAGPDADLPQLISQAMGGVATQDIQQSLQPQLVRVGNIRNRLDALQERYSRAADGPEKARIMREIQDQQEVLRTEVNTLVDQAGQVGIYTEGDDVLSFEDAAGVVASLENLGLARQDLAGLQGNFAQNVTEEQMEAVVGEQFRDMGEAALAMRARRLREAEEVSDEDIEQFREQNADIATDQQARQTLIQMRQARIEEDYARGEGEFTEEGVAEFQRTAEITEEEAEGVILGRRRQVALEPTQTDIEEFLAEEGTAATTYEYAQETLRARARAERFGIDRAEIEEAMDAMPIEDRSEAAATSQVIGRKIAERYEVTDADRDDYIARNVGSEQLTREQLDRAIFAEKQEESGERWAEYWDTDSGAVFRQSVDEAWEQIDDVSTRMLMSKQAMRHLGPQGLQAFKTIRLDQQRLRELAMDYAEGDMARLMAGDLTGVKDPEVAARVVQEAMELDTRLRQTFGDVAQQLQEVRPTQIMRTTDRERLVEMADEFTGGDIEELLSEGFMFEDVADPEQRNELLREFASIRQRARITAVEAERDSPELRRLAGQYTGGDVEQLLLGNFEAADDPAVQATIAAELGMARERTRDRSWAQDPDATARLLLGLPADDSGGPLSKEQRAQLTQMTRDVAVAGQLSDRDIEMIDEFRDTHEVLEDRAANLGVTKEELDRYLTTGEGPAAQAAIFTGLTSQQQSTLSMAAETWGGQQDRISQLEGSLDREKKALAAAEAADDTAGVRRAKREIQRIEGQIQTSRASQKEAVESVGDMWQGRAASAEAMLSQQRAAGFAPTTPEGDVKDIEGFARGWEGYQKKAASLAGAIEAEKRALSDLELAGKDDEAAKKREQIARMEGDLETTRTKQAEMAGLTRDELDTFLESGLSPRGREKIFVPLTEQETLTLETARKEWKGHQGTVEGLQGTLSAEQKNLDDLRGQLARTTDPGEKARIQKRIETKEQDIARYGERLTEAKTARDKSLEPIGEEMWRGRASSAQDLMTKHATGGLITQAALEGLRDEHQKQAERYAELEERAGEIDIEGGADVETLLQGRDVYTRNAEMNEQFIAMEKQSSTELMQTLFTEMGFAKGEYSKDVAALGRMADTEHGKAFARRMIATTGQMGDAARRRREGLDEEIKTLEGKRSLSKTERARLKVLQSQATALRGKKGADLAGELSEQYMAVRDNPEKLKQFRKSMGMQDDELFEAFETSAKWYESQLGRLDDLKGDKRAEYLGKSVEHASRLQSLERANAMTGEGPRQYMTLDGTLTIVGDQGDVNASGKTR